MNKPTLYFLFILLLSCAAYSQVSRYSVNQYSTANGLPNNLITDISWDSTGFLWVSTYNGIARFDGVWMESFTRNNYPAFKGEYTSGLSKNDKGQTVFADGNGRIYTIRKNKPFLIDSIINRSNPYIATKVFNLSSVIQQKIIKENIDFKGDQRNTALTDNSHCLYSENNKLRAFDAVNGRIKTVKEFRADVQLFKIRERIFLYEKYTQIYEIKIGRSGDDIDILPVEFKYPLKEVEIFWSGGMDNPVLLKGENSYLLYTDNNYIIRELICDQVPDYISITCMKYNQNSGVMVIGTNGNGIFICRKKVLDSYTNLSPDILSLARLYYSQVETEPGKLWLPYKNELNLATRKFESKTYIPDFKNAFKIGDSLILFNCKNGFVSSYNLKTKKSNNHFNSRSAGSSAFAITENRIFHGGDYGFTEMTSTGDTLFFAFKDPISRLNTFRDMLEYKPGYLVFSGCYGVFGFDIHTKKLDTLAAADPEACYHQMALYRDYLLIASYGKGVWIYKDKVIQRLPVDDKRMLLSAHNIYTDKDDNVWIGANAGIFIVKGEDVAKRFSDGNYRLNYKFLGKNYGLDLSELNGGWQGSVLLLSNGKLSYTGVNGIATISPADGTRKENFPLLFYDDIVINDSINFSAEKQSLLFPSTVRKIRLYFSLLDWNDVYNTTFEYRIKGISEGWTAVNFYKQNYIDFINLPAGDHTIEFNLQQGLERSQSNLSFFIEAHWYQTWLFYLAVILAGIGLTIGIIYWRLHYLRKKNDNLSRKVAEQVRQIEEQKNSLQAHIQEMKKYHEKLEKDYALKNRLISMIGHDIITPLRFMNRAGLILAESRDQISEDTYDDTMRTMLETSNNLHDMAVNMLSWIRHHQGTMKFTPSSFDFSQTFETLVNSIRPSAAQKQLTVVSKSASGIFIYQFQDAVKTILLQLLTNAVKYSEKGIITAEAVTIDQNIVVTIKDEGIGMPSDTVSHLLNTDKINNFTTAHDNKGHGFGFLIIKDMLRIVKGNMKIESVINSGTTIIVSFPQKAVVSLN